MESSYRRASTSRGTTYSAEWVGIDGYNSNTVEQIGTELDITNGTPSYYAWYEMYPSDSYNITSDTTKTGAIVPNSSFTVKPGNTISASVVYRRRISSC